MMHACFIQFARWWYGGILSVTFLCHTIDLY